MIDEKNLLRWIKTECNPYGKPTLDYETSIRIMEFIENKMEKFYEWIPVEERMPENNDYILLNFSNCMVPAIGRYEEDTEGGAFYLGDCDEKDTCISQNLYVDAWRPLPEPYRPEEPE